MCLAIIRMCHQDFNVIVHALFSVLLCMFVGVESTHCFTYSVLDWAAYERHHTSLSNTEYIGMQSIHTHTCTHTHFCYIVQSRRYAHQNKSQILPREFIWVLFVSLFSWPCVSVRGPDHRPVPVSTTTVWGSQWKWAIHSSFSFSSFSFSSYSSFSSSSSSFSSSSIFFSTAFSSSFSPFISLSILVNIFLSVVLL